MPQNEFDRRTALKVGASATAGGLLGGVAFAQTVEILGVPVKLPDIKIKSGPLNKVLMIAQIMEMEKKATSLRLPFSPLDSIKPPPLVSTDEGFYESAMPRLVSLIDRSEEADPATADKAGELLAQVNAEEREIPEALKDGGPLQVARSFSFPAIKSEYGRFWERLEIRGENKDKLDWYRSMVAQSRSRYQPVADATGVPWYFIGAIHGLEASFNFRAHLHNGDFPLSSRTRQVPAGRPLVWGPPSDWASSAKDAIKLMGFTGQSDWSLERTLYRLEAYNGFGYRKRAVATPYLWSFSNLYDRGKFVADGRFNPTARSQQCGAAALLKTMANAGDIKLG